MACITVKDIRLFLIFFALFLLLFCFEDFVLGEMLGISDYRSWWMLGNPTLSVGDPKWKKAMVVIP